jgi:hypothetical protein
MHMVEALMLFIILSFVTITKCILYIACFKISCKISEDILYVTSTAEMNELRDPCASTAVYSSVGLLICLLDASSALDHFLYIQRCTH